MEQIKLNIIKRTETLFLRYGLRSVTMDDIARELGISKKTLYQYFDNKFALIEAVMQQHLEEEQNTIEGIKKNATDALDEMLKIAQYVISQLNKVTPVVLFDLQKYHRESWDFFEKTNNETIYRHIRTNLERGITEGVYRNDLHTDIVAKLYVSKTTCILDEHIFPAQIYDKSNLFKEYMTYHMNGILSAYGQSLWKEHFKLITKSICIILNFNILKLFFC